ncbi:MAG: histidine ammonia-lyase [Bacteroidota bacterium]|nr:histidine ammonia-lyase [Bacteroidota bacterium]
MSYNYLPLDDTLLTFEQVKNYLRFDQAVSVTFAAHEAIVKCRDYLDQKLSESDELFYGINTGFGFLQHVRIDRQQLQALQCNLLLSHACGMGEEMPDEIVRLMLMLKIKSLSYGYSGVSIEVVKRLIDMHNNGVYPVIYSQGSLGASGDLAPLSHLCIPLIGQGQVRISGEKLESGEALKKMGWAPVELKSKEGLALINGTQFMSACGLSALVKSQRLLEWANLIAAISFDAFEGNKDSLNEHLHAIRSHKGQVEVAAHMRLLLDQSGIYQREKGSLQDPYSFRCIPQVHGASRDAFEFVRDTFLKEINSVTDNPNIFPDEDLILSGGNFHGQPLALGLDYLAIALSEIANISERRIYQLLSGQRSLPLFLVKEPGLNSGLMIPQYTAAGLVSENKQLCTPASVDSISSSNNQEDHVSMGANAATKCLRVVDNVEKVLAIELLSAVQAIEFRRPLTTSPVLEEVIAAFREKVSFNEADRFLHTDMKEAVNFLREFEI